ncbi:hypothetical protein M758_5G036700 [Ceratodon purpureus]|uniref:Bidirectional sugar transporter SWEET n=1 Tax=Ceratodon purpureus TaxID=3225 RepID=A0A8T0HZZ5_CERPU|nr:hypothetical protein KC19_5G036800 [Ceratodon purpureus]KAG0615382.1 hypothetical protein M758_5G036700 [Ceratodon purpureus]
MGHVDLKVVLGILGNITAICLFVSPIPTFIKIFKKKSVGDYSGIPYVATLLNCLLWTTYGLPWVKMQALVVSVNAAGTVLALIYIALYLTYAQKSIRMKVMTLSLAVVVGFIGVLVLVLEVVPDKEKRKLIIGTLAVVFSILMYASPLTIMRTVIKTRSVKYMPFLLSLFNFLNGVVWTGYAFIGGIDIFIVIPNGLGALSGVLQLALYAFYRNSTPRDQAIQDDTTVEKSLPMKTIPSSAYDQMEKGDLALNKQSDPLPKP